jgi:hypothetical protein
LKYSTKMMELRVNGTPSQNVSITRLSFNDYICCESAMVSDRKRKSGRSNGMHLIVCTTISALIVSLIPNIFPNLVLRSNYNRVYCTFSHVTRTTVTRNELLLFSTSVVKERVIKSTFQLFARFLTTAQFQQNRTPLLYFIIALYALCMFTLMNCDELLSSILYIA